MKRLKHIYTCPNCGTFFEGIEGTTRPGGRPYCSEECFLTRNPDYEVCGGCHQPINLKEDQEWVWSDEGDIYYCNNAEAVDHQDYLLDAALNRKED